MCGLLFDITKDIGESEVPGLVRGLPHFPSVIYNLTPITYNLRHGLQFTMILFTKGV